jgi:uncharacterized damage-inducible protein DinB
MDTEDLRYPIGPFAARRVYAPEERRQHFDQIAAAPERLAAAVRGLSAEQLDTPYREGGWTLRQVAHHLPDSHLGGYVRTKLTLTEDEPLFKTYFADRWAALPDSALTPVETSVVLLTALHERWMNLLRSLAEGDFARCHRHPKLGTDNPTAEERWTAGCERREPGFGVLSLDTLIALYAWHGRHHVGHIESLRRRMGWSADATSL